MKKHARDHAENPRWRGGEGHLVRVHAKAQSLLCGRVTVSGAKTGIPLPLPRYRYLSWRWRCALRGASKAEPSFARPGREGAPVPT